MPWFDLNTAQDLYSKLQRDYTALKEKPASVDLAYNFFVTAWHLLDWKYPGTVHTNTRMALRDSEPVLQVIDHLANGLKHFTLDAPRHTSVKITGRAGGYMGNYFGNYMGNWFGRSSLFVALDGVPSTTFGARVDVLALAESAMRFWDQQIKK